MPKFTFQVAVAKGKIQSGEMVASSRTEALLRLQEQGQTPLAIQELTSGSLWRNKVPRSAMGASLSGIADLLESGMPLLRSLEIIASQSVRPALRTSLTDLRIGVADGLSLANSMRQQPQMFDELTVNMVRVGEEGGFLESTLRRIANLIERQEELKSRMLSALAYPAFLGVTGLIVGAGMLLYFVPLFEPLFERMREVGELPFATVVLLDVSGTLKAWWPLVLLGIGVAVGLFLQWIKSPSGKIAWDRQKLQARGIGRSLSILRSLGFVICSEPCW